MVKKLSHLRRTHAALRCGDFFLIWQGGDAFAFLRRIEGQHALVFVNRGKAIERMELPVLATAPELLWGEVDVEVSGGATAIVNLAAASGAIVRL